MTPDELLDLLKAKSNARKQRSLEIINGICREQLDRGSRDFSIATIGRLSSEQGGPSPQTIRNKGGYDFRALIATWAEHSKGAMKKPPKIQESGISSILSKINDPAVRSIVGSILATNSKLQRELNLLKQQTEIVIDRRTIPLTSTKQQDTQLASFSEGLTPTELTALSHAISTELIEQEGWTIEKSGRVVNSLGRTIFRAGFTIALEKILSCHKKQFI
ncbi:MAG: gamma-mobile-trio protein GmtX [Geobacteraceae bacterium]|nr:gamma-mobile-trio protein GmtX [Geobacteraceae bacterium]